ncbi:hypothetical protein HD806DRAFT_532410 [Xylariaceae sp. AK1471]|nr:hypothetical protein HD806DRAFT_532410 [Xylariaceae sp. AK1471]
MAASIISSVQETPSKDKDKIAITLSSRSPSSITERRLVLTRGFPCVPIGRSSKVHSKGFVPADDNAWFDNPVMSRRHAEIFANFDDDKPPTVYIKDIESFHGTFHTPNDGRNSEQRITPNQPVKLINGDIIRFGIDIFRSNGTFPPCSVDFLMEEMAQKQASRLPLHGNLGADFYIRHDDLPHRVFTVPDDIDDEEDDDCEDEEDLTITSTVPKPTTTASGFSGFICHSGSHSGSERPPIDLTGDVDDMPPNNMNFSTSSTFNCNTSSVVIDLTSEPDYESDVEPCPVDTVASRSGVDVTSPSPTSSVRFPRYDGHLMRLIREADGRIIVPSSPSSPSDDEDDEDMYDDDLDESDIVTNSESGSDVSLESTEEMSELDELDEASRDGDSTSSELEDEHAALENFEEGYNLNTAPYFDDSDESSSAHDEDDGEIDDAATESSNNQTHTVAAVPLPGVTHQPTYSETANVPAAPPFDLPPLAPMSPLRPFAEHNSSRKRDPSPSDLALFKRRPLFDSSPNDSRAQTLGSKSGKLEFFAAREKNRAVVNQHNSNVPTSAIRETLLGVGVQTDGNAGSAVPAATFDTDTSRSPSPSLSCAPETATIAAGTEDNAPQSRLEVLDADAASIKLGDTDTNQFSAWSKSGDRFINNPRTEDIMALEAIRLQQADFDMASAYKFRQSKLATAAQTVINTRRLPIKDLLAQEPKECSLVNQPTPQPPSLETVKNSPAGYASTPTKRSFEEAFNQIEDDVTCNCVSDNIMPCSPQITKTQDQSQNTHEVPDAPAVQTAAIRATADIGAQDTVAQKPAVVPVQSETSRPLKKLRLATQVAACVALGGAVTFSYLVTSAPVF